MVDPNSLANLIRFKPGKSGCPSGRSGFLPPEVRAARKKNQAALITLVSKMFSETNEEIKIRKENPETNQLEHSILGIIKSCKYGNVWAFNEIMKIMCGKIPEADLEEYSELDLLILGRVKDALAKRAENEPRD